MSGLATRTESPDVPQLPHPPRRLPILGDLFSMNVNKPTQSLTRMAAGLGPLFEFTALGSRYVIAQGADVVRELNDEARFGKHVGVEMEALRLIVGDGLFTAYNDEPNWYAAHELLMPAFTQSAMHRYHDTMLEVTGEFLARWDGAVGRRTVDVSADTTRATLETIARCAAGYSFGLFDSDAVHPFVGHMVSGLKHCDLLGAARASALPKFFEWLAERQVRRHGRYLTAAADEIIAARRAMTGGAPDDLLQLMLGSDLDPVNIRYQLITFLVAGHETTSGHCLSRCTSWPGTQRSTRGHGPRSTRCGVMISGRRSNRWRNCATSAGCSTSHCGCSPRCPATTGRPARTPRWRAAIRCARVIGHWR